jgi:hypothetical protein
MAETYGLDLVADAYQTQRFGRQPPAAPQETAQYEALTRHLGWAAEWARDGEFLRIRSRTWYHDRPAEIPARVARHWVALLRREQRLSLDHAAALAVQLTDAQWPQLGGVLQDGGVQLQADGLGRSRGFSDEVSREILRTYGTLSPRQQEHLRSGGQIALAELPPASQRWLLAAFEQRQRQFAGPELPPGEPPPGLLSLSALTVRREVTSADENQVRSILRALDGPKAGQQIASSTVSGSLAAGMAEGGQQSQQLAWRYQYGETQAVTFNLDLPWIRIEPSVKPEADMAGRDEMGQPRER